MFLQKLPLLGRREICRGPFSTCKSPYTDSGCIERYIVPGVAVAGDAGGRGGGAPRLVTYVELGWLRICLSMMRFCWIWCP